MTTKTTLDLQPGDVVLIGWPVAKTRRTVARVVPNGYVNHRDEPLYNVLYAEGDTPEWSGGNSSNGSGTWQVAS